jgi:HK97 family phage major capsid protein
MNYRKRATELKNALDALLKLAKTENRAFTPEEKTKYEADNAEYDNCIAMIDVEDKAAQRAATHNDPVDAPAPSNVSVVPGQEPKFFNSFAQQLAAVKNFATSGHIDERLSKVNNQLGMNEKSGSEGGFAVQTDFAGMLMDTAVKESGILSAVDTYNVSAGSNSVKWVDIDEDSVETSVFGGVQVYWVAEAADATRSMPKLKEKELKLEKLMGLAYSTYELDADSNFIDQLYTRAFQTAIRRELENCVIGANGIGVGKPLSILNGGAIVNVAAEGGQAAGSIVWENISKMYHRALEKDRGIWLVHPDAHEQLDFLSFPVGVGGVPVYLPATQVGSIASLRGRPIVESDHCSTLGAVGDIMFIDPKEYVLIYKGGVQKDVSIHVQFLSAQNAFRFIFRANGMPKRSKSLKIKNTTNRRSAYIALAAR